MSNFKMYDASFQTVAYRFYLVMAIVIIAGFSEWWALGFLALPIFLLAILGVSLLN